MTWSFTVVDYAETPDGPIVFELQPLLSISQDTREIGPQSFWSVIGADSPYDSEYQMERAQQIMSASGLISPDLRKEESDKKSPRRTHEPVEFDVYNNPPLIAHKVTQRGYLNKKLSPPHIISKPQELLNPENETELKKVFESADKMPDGSRYIVIKLPNESRGDGNFFVKAKSFDELRETLLHKLKHQTFQKAVARVAHYTKYEDRPIIEYEQAVSVEACINPLLSNGTRMTQRVILAHNDASPDSEPRVIPTTAWVHSGYNSHDKIARVDYLTGYTYNFKDHTVRKAPPPGLRQETEASFKALARDLSERQKAAAEAPGAHPSYRDSLCYDPTPSPNTLSNYYGDISQIMEEAYYMRGNTGHPISARPEDEFSSLYKLLEEMERGSEYHLADQATQEAIREDAQKELHAIAMQQISKLHPPKKSTDIDSALGILSAGCETGKGGRETPNYVKRLLFECEYGREKSRRMLPLQANSQTMPETYLNITLRRAINEMKEQISMMPKPAPHLMKQLDFIEKELHPRKPYIDYNKIINELYNVQNRIPSRKSSLDTPSFRSDALEKANHHCKEMLKKPTVPKPAWLTNFALETVKSTLWDAAQFIKPKEKSEALKAQVKTLTHRDMKQARAILYEMDDAVIAKSEMKHGMMKLAKKGLTEVRDAFKYLDPKEKTLSHDEVKKCRESIQLSKAIMKEDGQPLPERYGTQVFKDDDKGCTIS